MIKAVVALRSVKEACEIEEIDLACNIGYEMHTAAIFVVVLPYPKRKLLT